MPKANIAIAQYIPRGEIVKVNPKPCLRRNLASISKKGVEGD
jgi:hypothetical protein